MGRARTYIVRVKAGCPAVRRPPIILAEDRRFELLAVTLTLFSKQVQLLAVLSSTWLGVRDSNPNLVDQNHSCCLYTNSDYFGVTEENRTPVIGITTRRFAIKLRPTYMAEGKGFEPLELLHSLVFKTSALDRYANLLRESKHKMKSSAIHSMWVLPKSESQSPLPFTGRGRAYV